MSNLLYKVENLYRSDNGILISNAIKFDLKLGEAWQLYKNVFETLKDFYGKNKFYVKQKDMVIDKPIEWQSDPPLYTGAHQLWKDGSRKQKKGNIVVTIKEDTRRNVEKIVGYEAPNQNLDTPTSSLFGGGRYIYETKSLGSKPALFLFINSFSPYYNPSQESGEDKQYRRQAETLALAHFFGDRNQEKALVFFESDLEQKVR